MHITQLEIQGFKSFADKTVLQFDRGITAIVGPNGSGKSNVADAIRWVLGEQRLKNLRGKKSEDVIFHGSKNRVRAGLARVTLTLDNTDSKGALDAPEIVMSRTLDRSGESIYRMNGHVVKLQDIILFLAKSHFGQKSYAIIGQGMIDRIVNATPEQRKEFFDEATGVKALQIKRDNAVLKLLRAEDHCQQIDVLLQEIEPRLRSLKRQVSKLSKREKIEAELREVFKEYFGSLWHSFHTRSQSLTSEQESLQQRQVSLEFDIQTLQTESDALARNSENAEERKKIDASIHEFSQNLQEQLQERAVLNGRLSVAHATQGTQQLHWLQEREQELLTRQKDLQQNRDHTQKNINDLSDHLQRLQAELAGIQKQIKESENELHQNQTAASHPDALPLAQLRQRLSGLYHDYEKLLERLLAAKTLEQFLTIRSDAQEITLMFAELIDQLESHDHEQFTRTADILRERLSTLLDQKEHFTQTLNELRVNHETEKERLLILSQEEQKITQELRRVQNELVDSQKKSSEKSGDEKLQTQLKQLDQSIETLRKKLSESEHQRDTILSDEQQLRTRIIVLQQQARGKQQELNVVNQKIQEVAIEIAKTETRIEDLRTEAEQEELAEKWEVIQRSHTSSPTTSIEELRNRAQQLKKQLEWIGGIDPETIQEHEETEKRFEFLSRESEDLRKTMTSLHRVIDDLDRNIKQQFESSFRHINQDFKKYFHLLFQGGEAKLELLQEQPAPETTEEGADNSEIPTETPSAILSSTRKQKILSGIDIHVHPPTKKILHISMLSGGEKALVSIALLSAILHTNPSPFVVLDEVEAALDEANSSRFAQILSDLNRQTQFILITHNREVMKHSDVLYGVTMDSEGVSKLLSVKLSDIQDKVIGRSSPDI